MLTCGCEGEKVELMMLPDGYRLFTHHTRKPGGQPRTDGYLFGGARGVKFRSPNEFKAHVVALAMDLDGTPHFEM